MVSREKSVRDLSNPTLHDANLNIPAVTQEGEATKRPPGAPTIEIDNRRMRRLFRFVKAGVPVKDLHIVMKEEPSVTNPAGFTIGKSSVRKYWIDTAKMLPGAFQRLGDKTVQNERNQRTFKKFVAARIGRRDRLSNPSLSFEKANDSSDYMHGIERDVNVPDADDTPIGLFGAATRKPALIPHDPSNGPSNSISYPTAMSPPNQSDAGAPPKPVTKRPCPYTDDGEYADRISRKTLLHGADAETLAVSLNSPVLAPGFEPTRSRDVEEAHEKTVRTVEDVEKAMNREPGYLDAYRWSVSSTINSTWNTYRTAKSRDSAAPDLPVSSSDAELSTQLSPSFLGSSLFEKLASSTEDEQAAAELRYLLEKAGPFANELANGRDQFHKSPLETVNAKGWHKCCMALLDHGADVKQLTSSGMTLSRFSRKAQKAASEDIKLYYAIGICHKLVTTWFKPSSAPKSGRLFARKSLTFVNPRPAPAPPIPYHSSLSTESTPALELQGNDGSSDRANMLSGKFQVQRSGESVPTLVQHFESFKRTRTISSRVISHNTPHSGIDSSVMDGLLFGKNPDAMTNMLEVGREPSRLNEPTALEDLHAGPELAQGDAQSKIVGSLVALPDGQVVAQFPVSDMIASDIPNAPVPVLYRSNGNRNNWCFGDDTTFLLPRSTARVSPTLSPLSQPSLNSQFTPLIHEDSGDNFALKSGGHRNFSIPRRSPPLQAAPLPNMDAGTESSAYDASREIYTESSRQGIEEHPRFYDPMLFGTSPSIDEMYFNWPI